MVWKKNRHIILTFAGAMMFSLLLLYLGTNGLLTGGDSSQDNWEITLVATSPVEEMTIKAGTYVYEEQHYQLCNEREAKLVVNHNHLIDKTVDQVLQQDYLSSEGWQVDIIKEDTLVFYQEIQGFCPRHEAMRHLAIVDNHVAIMYGPRNTHGGIAKMSNILASTLPGQLRQQIETGLLEFASHDDALQALDTLDEYNQSP